VLFIEKGLFLHDLASAQPQDPEVDATTENPDSRLRSGRWPLRLQGRTSFGPVEFFAPLGCGSGGSTALYAAALERFFPSDFAPRANFPRVSDSTLPEKWPIDYEELRPFYAQAEWLFRVRGTPDPLRPLEDAPLLPAPPLSARDEAFMASFRRLGLHPYRVHVGFEYVEGCGNARGCASVAARATRRASACFRRSKTTARACCRDARS
jgi:choline dehydrogenase-like flavoprotein